MTDVQGLIRSLEERDIRLAVVEGRLRVDAPKGSLTDELRRTLQDRKVELIAALQCDWSVDAQKVIEALPDAALRPLLLDYYQETAALLEHEAGLTRHDAEQQAFGLLLFQILRCGIDAKANLSALQRNAP